MWNATTAHRLLRNTSPQHHRSDYVMDDVMNDVTPRVIFAVVYCVIFLLGVAGNSLVVYVVARSAAMQTMTNVFIANLAVADITMCLLAVPFTPLSGLLRSWVFGDFLCHVVPMSLGVSVYVSTLTSTAIAIDRHCFIVHPFRARLKVPAGLALIGAIWVVAVFVSLPLAVYRKVEYRRAEEVYECREDWPQPTARQFFTVVSLVLQYVVPCSVIAYCYIKVTIFACCWLPLNAVHLIAEYHAAVERWNYFFALFLVAHVIAMSSTVYNPLLYAGMNENFRKEFYLLMPRAMGCFERLLAGSNDGLSAIDRGGSQHKSCETQMGIQMIGQAGSIVFAPAAPQVFQQDSPVNIDARNS